MAIASRCRRRTTPAGTVERSVGYTASD